MSSLPSISQALAELNVGGREFTTTLSTLRKHSGSVIAEMFADPTILVKDNRGKYFIDRDGDLFRYILDYLRDGRIILPSNYENVNRLIAEAEYFRLPQLVALLSEDADRMVIRPSPSAVLPMSKEADNLKPGCLTIGYRGTFAFGRDGLVDVKFRKILRILVCGRVSIARDVFGESLNESRDPDRGLSSRYTSRFYLKHVFLEHAFDMLLSKGFRLISSAGSGAAGTINGPAESEESKWYHYNEFVFCRP
ncbi:BTB/POZ domain-containing protein KCTD16-like [Anneissia japonica]|uniref:BTB/POZ domain-containing protein KCTD16-like n=1 Tax=Anneissia japonica TaxID=1529436 RepID=UPI001425B1AD|nr:BTB/POZ domain-containing protein KCTD16-like [Anneissia japonica]